MSDSNSDWVGQKALEECSTQFRTVWDIYIKWYTVFLTFNILALGVVVEHLKGRSGRIVALVMVAQNLISLATAIQIAGFSNSSQTRASAIAKWLASNGSPEAPRALPPEIEQFPIPGKLGFWSGWANAMSHVFLIVFWIAAYFLD